MNKRDLKLYMLYNGYQIEPKNTVISFSLDPHTHSKLKALREKYGMNVKREFIEWVKTLDFINNYQTITYEEIDAKLTKLKHSDYKFNSFYVDIETLNKISRIKHKYKLSTSAIVRFFLNQLN